MTTRNKVKNLLIIFFFVAVIGAINFCYLSGYCKFGADPTVNNVTSFSLETYSNFETISVYANIAGDDNGNSTGSFRYRESGDSDWIDGMTMSSIYGSTKKAGFFFVSEGASYDIKLTISDPDGVPGVATTETTATARNSNVTSSGTSYYVSVDTGNNDTNAGTTPEQPFKTINKASEVATAGDTVNIMSGTYRERIDFGNINPNQRGTADNWITFKNYDEKEVILDGSYEELPTWEEFDPINYPGIYRTQLDWNELSFYVDNLTVDSETAYRFTTLDALKTNGIVDRFGQPVVPVVNKLGWAREETPTNNKISVYLQIFQGNANPNYPNHTIRLTRPEGVAFALDATSYIKIQGLTFKNHSNAIRLTSNSGDFNNIIIDDNKFIDNVTPISILGNSTINPEGAGNNITIQNNEITETGLYGLNWSALKGSSQESSGIHISNINNGIVVRNNLISGYFNGVFLGAWPPKYGYSFDADTYDNVFIDGGDDGVEIDGSNATNVRAWNNQIKNFGTTLSVAPLLAGPVYFFRNTGQNVGMGVKLGSAHETDAEPLSQGYLYVYHNTFNATQTEGSGAYCTNQPTYQNSTFLNNIFNTDGFLIVHGSGEPYDGSEDCVPQNVLYDYNLMYSHGHSAGNTEGTGDIVMWTTGQYVPEQRYLSISAFSASTGQAEHSIVLPPIFQDFENGDFRLANSSPGVDFGTELQGFNDCNSKWPVGNNWSLSGTAPDVGAYETEGADACSAPPIDDPDPDPTDPSPDPTVTPTPTDTTNYLILPVARFSSSWNMVSFPDTSGAVTDDSLIPSGLRLRRYDTASNSYRKGENSSIELRLGQGFWLNIDNLDKIGGLRYPLIQRSSTEIAVTKGWNLLGNPYQSDLPLSNLKVKYKDGTTRSYSDAIVRKEVAGYAWSYEGSEKKYYFIAINPNNYKTDSPKSTVIKPFRGFWTIVKSDQVASIRFIK